MSAHGTKQSSRATSVKSHLRKSSPDHLRSNRASMPTSAFGGGTAVACVHWESAHRRNAGVSGPWDLASTEICPYGIDFATMSFGQSKLRGGGLRDRAAAIVNMSDAEPMRFASTLTYSRFDCPVGVRSRMQSSVQRLFAQKFDDLLGDGLFLDLDSGLYHCRGEI